MEWISIKDRLPETYKHCIVFCRLSCCTKFVVLVATKTKKGWDGHGEHIDIKDVSFWMPLPEPPN